MRPEWKVETWYMLNMKQSHYLVIKCSKNLIFKSEVGKINVIWLFNATLRDFKTEKSIS